MKKILIILFTAIIALTAISCGAASYPPVESTAEERAILITFDYEGEEYDITYELYRALFLNNREAVDGGDRSVWTSENNAEYVKKIEDIIVNSAAEIFATLHHAKKIGINPYSREIESLIDEFIRIGVEGSQDANGAHEGFGGDYDKYLESLKEMNLNYSTQVMLCRYAICYEKIVEYYAGTYDADNPSTDMSHGKLEYTDKDVLDFYTGEDSVRVILATLDSRSFSKTRANEIRDRIASFGSLDAVKDYIKGFTASTAADVEKGVLIGKYSLDPAFYSELTKAAFSIELDETSQVVEVSTDEGDYYFILYKTEKTSEYLDDCRADVTRVYVKNRIGKLLSDTKDAIASTRVDTVRLNMLDRGEIKM
jgi:hypothetical protein